MSVRQTLSGTYHKAYCEKGEYWYFLPKPLPPELSYNNELMYLGMEAQRYLSELGTKANQLPSITHFINSFMKKEAEFSCQLEGTQSNIQDALEEEAGVERRERPRDSKDIVNYLRALGKGVGILESTSISLWFIRAIHEQLLEHQPEKHPGSFREEQNYIGGVPYDITTADFVPPPPFEMKDCLDKLEVFIKQPVQIPPLIKIALIHAQFETIHPFGDGNGRVGRQLITFQLYQEKIIEQPVLYLSYFFKKHKEEYHELLQAIHDRGAWEEWVRFFLTGIIETSKSALDLAESIRVLHAECAKQIEDSFGAGKQESPQRLLYALFSKPIISADDVRVVTERSKAYCYNLIAEFENLQIVEEITGQQRGKKYEFKKYLDLLASVKS